MDFLFTFKLINIKYQHLSRCADIVRIYLTVVKRAELYLMNLKTA